MLRYILRSILGLLALVVVATLIVGLFRIPVSLGQYKPLAESTLGKALGREVSIDGDVVVTTSLWPYFKIEGLRIANPGGLASGELASMDLAWISVGALPLLKGSIEIREFRVSGLALNLERSVNGDVNWLFPQAVASAEEGPEATASEETRLASDSLVVNELSLEDIRVSFRDGDDAPLEFVLEQLEGAAGEGEPMSLSMQGTLLDENFTLDVEASSLGEFLAMAQAELSLQLKIAGTRLQFSGVSEALRGGGVSEFHALVEGANLSSLNDLLLLDLPPLNNYRLRADMRSSPGKLELSDLEASLGESKLLGTMVINETGKRPFATLDLTASRIQLTDFDTGDWSAQGADPQAEQKEDAEEQAAELQPESEDQVERDKLMSQQALRRADARLTVTVEEVLSGADKLGSGKLQLTLKDGRIDLDPLQLQLSDSSLLLKASLKPDIAVSDASLRVLVENFDFGALVRMSDPESEVGGTLSVDIDVTASASNIDNILSGANGYLDISSRPQNLRSGLVDLWAVNLVSAVVSSAAKDEEVSVINCLLGRFRLVDGLMTAENLAVDTSKIRICGEGEINFVDHSFDLVVGPTAKRAEYFSLATPLAAQGSFDDFRIGTKAGVLSLGSTAIEFAASPVTTPIKRIFQDELPEDGADICALPIGPREEELKQLPGC